MPRKPRRTTQTQDYKASCTVYGKDAVEYIYDVLNKNYKAAPTEVKKTYARMLTQFEVALERGNAKQPE